MSKSKKAAVKKSSPKDLEQRLGPVREVVKMTRATDTKASYNLRLACGHTRVATKRSAIRCRKCRKGGK